MTLDQTLAGFILLGALILFIWGRLRYDVVAVLALLAVALAGLVPADELLSGFGHPAVITVAAVLIISRALRNSGIVDWIAHKITPYTENPVLHITSLSSLCALASAFMNNVGALAVLLPVALSTAHERGRSPAILLMPLAFGSILGGLMTLIGTPPNIIIAGYRASALGEPFGMFDFSAVGVPVALLGVMFTALIGWRLLPEERQGQKPAEELFQITHYLTELRVVAGSDWIGQSLSALERRFGEDVIVVGFTRANGDFRNPAPWLVVREGDVLTVRSDPKELSPILEKGGVEVVSDGPAGREKVEQADLTLLEAVVTPASPLVSRSPAFVRWRSGYSLRLLALARSGLQVSSRLQDKRLAVGDVLLLQANDTSAQDALRDMGLLPLPERGLRLGQPRRLALSVGIFAIAIACSIMGVLPIGVAFLGAIVAYLITGVLEPREIYTQIDWPVIVLLGAMIPVGNALEQTGLTATIADGLLDMGSAFPSWLILTLVMVVTMTLSDLINNAATALIMAPISVAIAQGLGVSHDPFLMAVAVGASCAFLTPIGHQSNTLVMGPGGYRFSDYWRMGLPLEVLIVAVSVPLILIAWPF